MARNHDSNIATAGLPALRVELCADSISVATMFSTETSCLRLPAILPRPSLVAPHASPDGTTVGTVAVASGPPPSSVRSGIAEAVSCEPEGDAGSAPRLVRIVAVVGEGTVSPLKGASWEQVMLHTIATAGYQSITELLRRYRAPNKMTHQSVPLELLMKVPEIGPRHWGEGTGEELESDVGHFF
ncbi:unnamed protein product [Spirodela intermedia]|uniref:Uncharacterized protein n=1 Tax=Spirodela intermedia TaxID=51605 RepID=A0A7I8J9W9_SPIIN|nr:unnamed protein product [Spirodela intermedia]CAA6666242.1 unnamed protein product [Spirodela intermedia]